MGSLEAHFCVFEIPALDGGVVLPAVVDVSYLTYNQQSND
jgi:hypothetical protein